MRITTRDYCYVNNVIPTNCIQNKKPSLSPSDTYSKADSGKQEDSFFEILKRKQINTPHN